MSGRYAKLKKDWSLRGWTDAPTAIVNWANGLVLQVNAKGFYVAESCDGETDFDSLAFLPDHHALLDALIAEGIAEAGAEGDSIEPCQRYRKANTPRLKGLQWCLTGRCNLHCRHCYMESPSARYGELPFEDIVRLIEQFEQANLIRVTLTGGEPFLRTDILDIIALLTQKRICVSQIFSNGLLITEEHLKGIQSFGSVPTFQISFDGVGAHDSMRGCKGIEKGVTDSILKIQAAGFPVVVSTSIDKVSIGRMTETYELMEDLGVKFWRVGAPQKAGNWRGTATALTLREEALALQPLMERWLKDGRPFHIQLSGFYSGSQTTPEMQDTPKYTPDAFDCGACREQPNLLPDGTLVPCPGYVDSIVQARMPNLCREDLSEVWANSYLREIVNVRKKDLLAKNPECAACELFKDCGIGCRASALAETGDLMAKDPISCEVWRSGYKKPFEELAQLSG